jgi:competence protein ComEA
MSQLPALWALQLIAMLSQAQETPANIVDKFPKSESSELVTSICSECHSLARVMANHRTVAEWAQTIKIHEGRGLNVEAAEAEAIAKYLGDYFGPTVNINATSISELSALPNIGKAFAEALVAYRAKNGPFKTVDDLLKVPGVTPQTFDEIKRRLTIGPPNPGKREN